MKLNKKLRYTFLIQFALVIMAAFLLNTGVYGQDAENLSVNGKIVDNAGQPLIGASIIVEGTTTGSLTDANGGFSIVCPKGKTLVISYVGYKNQKVTVNSADNLSIVLEEDYISLGEATIVVVGYGSMRKSDLTGAISTVSADNMKKGVVSSSEQLLQGKIAGLTVIQGSGDPTMGATVRLRGGTSLTAANGPLIVVDGISGVDINTVQPSEIVSMDVLKDASATAIYGSRGANGVIIVTTNRANKGKITEYSGYVAVGQVSHNIDMLSGNQWRQYVRDNSLTTATDYGANTNWQKEIEQTSISQSHSLSYNNASDESGYRVSLNYLSNQGIIKTSKLERLGISISAFQKSLHNRLKLEAGVHTNFDKYNALDYTIFQRTFNINPTIPVKDANGKFTEVANTLYENPVEINNNRSSANKRHRLLGFGNAELEILKGLKANANLSYEYNSNQTGLYVPTYAQLVGQPAQGYGQKTLGDYVNTQLETYLTYNKDFSNHKINLVAGYSYLDNIYDGFGAERRGFASDLFENNNLGAGTDFRAGDVYSYKGEAKLISFYGRAAYNFKSRYMLTATLRRDGSTRFGANHKWGMFPSASAAWRISDESFMKWSSSWLTNMKLRVGYGVTGNQDGIGEYKSLYTIGAGTYPYYDPLTGKYKQSYGPSQNANPDLKWESTAQINIGLDFALFNRINGTIEVYQKKTSDLLYTYDVPQPPYLVGKMLANVGDMENKGIEVTLNSNIIKTKDFSWDVNFNVASNMQKITNLSSQLYKAADVKSGSLHGLPGMSGEYAQIIKEGYAVGTFWGYKNHGLDAEGKFVNDTVKQDLGNVQPKLSLGFGMNFTYKRFDLGISTYGMFGQKVLDATDMVLYDNTRMASGYNVPDDFVKSGIKDKAVYSSYWVKDASFFRLQSVSLGYTIMFPKSGFEKIRVYATGENLFVITNYKGIDPEVSIDGLDAPGMDAFNVYPKPRTFSFGVKLSF